MKTMDFKSFGINTYKKTGGAQLTLAPVRQGYTPSQDRTVGSFLGALGPAANIFPLLQLSIFRAVFCQGIPRALPIW